MKYTKMQYVWILSLIVKYLENKPEIVEDIINFSPKSDRETLKDIFNQY